MLRLATDPAHLVFMPNVFYAIPGDRTNPDYYGPIELTLLRAKLAKKQEPRPREVLIWFEGLVDWIPLPLQSTEGNNNNLNLAVAPAPHVQPLELVAPTSPALSSLKAPSPVALLRVISDSGIRRMPSDPPRPRGGSSGSEARMFEGWSWSRPLSSPIRRKSTHSEESKSDYGGNDEREETKHEHELSLDETSRQKPQHGLGLAEEVQLGQHRASGCCGVKGCSSLALLPGSFCKRHVNVAALRLEFDLREVQAA